MALAVEVENHSMTRDFIVPFPWLVCHRRISGACLCVTTDHYTPGESLVKKKKGQGRQQFWQAVVIWCQLVLGMCISRKRQ